MADSTKEIIHGIIQGFRDSILGISKILKYDASIDNSEGELKKNEPQTTLARRRAEKQKLKGNLENKGNKKRTYREAETLPVFFMEWRCFLDKHCVISLGLASMLVMVHRVNFCWLREFEYHLAVDKLSAFLDLWSSVDFATLCHQ